MDGRHVLTLVNGKRISASDGVIGHSDFQYDWIPIEGIERIEVIRGPMSVLYGSEALGGVINVILRQPGDDLGRLGDARRPPGHRRARRRRPARGRARGRAAGAAVAPGGDAVRRAARIGGLGGRPADQRDRGPPEARCPGAAGLAARRRPAGGGGILGRQGGALGHVARARRAQALLRHADRHRPWPCLARLGCALGRPARS